MSITFAEAMDLKNTRGNTEHTVELLVGMNKKMDKQIALLEQMVEILTKIEERHTDADY